jgi:two-component system LytT family response regulator
MSLHGRSIAGAPLARTATEGRTGGTFDVPRGLTLMGRSEDRAVSGGAAAEHSTSAREYLDRIAIKSRSRILFLDTREVAWLEAYGNYVRFHAWSVDGAGTTPAEATVHTVRGTLSSYERRLDPGRFVRIHRSVIVNVDVVRELHARRTGDFTLVTRSGEKLTLSRNFRSRVAELRRLLAS